MDVFLEVSEVGLFEIKFLITGNMDAAKGINESED